MFFRERRERFLEKREVERERGRHNERKPDSSPIYI